MRTLTHAASESNEQLSLIVPDGWRDAIDGDMLLLSRGEKGTGALQLSLAPHLYDASLEPGDLGEMASYFATDAADVHAGRERTWKAEGGQVVCGSAGAKRGDWFVHCFVLKQGTRMAFGTYVCREADSPGELLTVERMLRSLELQEVRAETQPAEAAPVALALPNES